MLGTMNEHQNIPKPIINQLSSGFSTSHQNYLNDRGLEIIYNNTGMKFSNGSNRKFKNELTATDYWANMVGKAHKLRCLG